MKTKNAFLRFVDGKGQEHYISVARYMEAPETYNDWLCDDILYYHLGYKAIDSDMC